MLSAEEVDWISSEDFKEMKSLGIDNPKEYFKQKENKVTDKNVESILLESVEHVTVNETSLPTLIVIDNFFKDPLKSGTSMYVHKETGIDAIRNQEWNIFKGNFYDDTPFEVVDKIGNKYNRCVLMDARLIHAASRYFGDAITNDRLFQIYFFNTEEQK